ncbi:MAG TPA: hypothetical protein VMH87_08960 [Pseudomonadales bacterium]|nr:hypothetical protein [Pseudomonadales bacterium]
MLKKIKPSDREATIEQRRSEPEPFSEEMARGSRESHLQNKFFPAAMYFSLSMRSRWNIAALKPNAKAADCVRKRSPGTLRLDKNNVKRKPAVRGRIEK